MDTGAAEEDRGVVFERATGAEDRGVAHLEPLTQGVFVEHREVPARPETRRDTTNRADGAQVSVELLPGLDRIGFGGAQERFGGRVGRNQVAGRCDLFSGLFEVWSQRR